MNQLVARIIWNQAAVDRDVNVLATAYLMERGHVPFLMEGRDTRAKEVSN